MCFLLTEIYWDFYGFLVRLGTISVDLGCIFWMLFKFSPCDGTIYIHAVPDAVSVVAPVAYKYDTAENTENVSYCTGRYTDHCSGRMLRK